ncbi:MAG: hypothetical protein HY716_09920 [Planctomycetes bacterium]|nr:hypothetical protein [Planctomycetota bacterium]
MEHPEDLLLGRIAVERGLITETQLEETFREQTTAGCQSGRTVLPPLLGDLLIAKGWIQKEDLQKLLREQIRRFQSLDPLSDSVEADLQIGQILVRRHQATQNQVNKCLEIQLDLADSGRAPVPLLGELLVRHGYVSETNVREALQAQRKPLPPPDGDAAG